MSDASPLIPSPLTTVHATAAAVPPRPRPHQTQTRELVRARDLERARELNRTREPAWEQERARELEGPRGAEGAPEPEEDGWPDLPGDSALTIRLPEADPLVRAGFPAHVTVLYPFLHERLLDARAHRELADLFAGHDAFSLTLAAFGRYPGVLYLDPWPHDPVKALTKEVTQRWPQALPYRGVFGPGLDPHVTVANSEGPATQDAVYAALEAELAPSLPLTCPVDAVHLIVWDGARWRDRAAYRLGHRAR